MAPITAIVLDRLLEPGASKSVDTTGLAKSYSEAAAKDNARARSSERKPDLRLQIKPALYATPEAKPLPNSPTPFSPSPYIINHKLRGPRLGDKQKDNANANLVPNRQTSQATKTGVGTDDENRENAVGNSDGENFETPKNSILEEEITYNRTNIEAEWEVRDVRNEVLSCSLMVGLLRDGNEADGTDMEMKRAYTDEDKDNETEFYEQIYTPKSEFSDAWEDPSSESGRQSSLHNVEAELQAMSLSLLMEIDKRKRAEEAIRNMRDQWEKLKQQLSVLGVTLPSNITCASEASSKFYADDICQQVYVARFVSNAIGRAAARAEAEAIMEEQIETKNFEITRLWDRLRYYEAVNHEMFQRNQDVLELERNKREVRKRRQRWIWGSIALALTLGSGTLAWSYLPTGRGSSTADSC